MHEPSLEALAAQLDAPFAAAADVDLGADFAAQLRTVSSLWFRCGYGPGIAAYLNFFLLRDFLVLHDDARPQRFRTVRTMAKSFYETDLFIRAVTDSGREPTGGISSPHVRSLLRQTMARHRALAIPPWMMSYFGQSLLEAVEARCAPLDDEQRRLHAAYMSTTYRIMGIPFAADRRRMQAFARDVERRHAAMAPQSATRAAHILRIGELIGESTAPARLLGLLPEATRAVFAKVARDVRPGFVRRLVCRVTGRLLVPRAVGRPRVALPWARSLENPRAARGLSNA